MLSVYSATKAYVTNFSEGLHEEAKRHGVVVTALCPGLTRTEFQSVSNTTEFQSNFPAFAWCPPEMVAKTGLEDCAKGRALSVPGGIYKGLVVGKWLVTRRVTHWAYSTAILRR